MSVSPPVSEQNCLGTALPCESVVNVARRVPSPAASTTAQGLPIILIDRVPPHRLQPRATPRRWSRGMGCWLFLRFGDVNNSPTDQTLARSLGKVDPCIGIRIFRDVPVTGVGGGGAIVLAGL